MSLWLRVRAVPILFAMAGATAFVLVLPWSVVTATPSPAGASVAAASIVALAVPVAVAWAIGRGDGRLESVSARPIRMLDLGLAGVVVGVTIAAAVALFVAQLAPTGLVAARALAVDVGLLLVAQPFAGWRLAAVAPTVYLTAVVVMGRGEDIAHPAVWAWIAADGIDTLSWTLTLLVLVAGLVIYIVAPPRHVDANTEE